MTTGRHLQVMGRDVASRNLPNILLIFLILMTARSVLRAEVERLMRHQERGQINADLDVPRYVQVYWGTLHGISRLLLDGVYTDSASVKQLCEATADMLWQQLDPG